MKILFKSRFFVPFFRFSLITSFFSAFLSVGIVFVSMISGCKKVAITEYNVPKASETLPPPMHTIPSTPQSSPEVNSETNYPTTSPEVSESTKTV